MLRNTRMLIGLGLLGGISIAGIVGWATGFFAQVVSFAGGVWSGFTTWLSSPFSWNHLLAGAGVLLIPIIIIVVIFVIVDD